MAAKKAKSASVAKTPPAPKPSWPPIRWPELIGHDRLIRAFGVALRKDRLAGSFLFVGSAGVGKTTTALLLARTLLCETESPADMDPCGTCQGCVQVLAGTHPDLIQVRKPGDKTQIPLELLIGPPEARMREGFCHEIHLRPMRGRRKVAILHDADFLNEEGANCLLKTLEEPPGNALIVLVGMSEQRQLPTIRSRCQIMRFATPIGDAGAALLRRRLRRADDGHEPGVAAIIDQATDGQLADAIDLAAGDLRLAGRLVTGQSSQIRDALATILAEPTPDPMALIRVLNGHLDAVGKETPKRREALREAAAIILEHYRHQLRRDAASGHCHGETADRLDRTVRLFRELDRMGNLSTLVECFAADLTLAQTGNRGGIG